jgi:hypothetical protein
MKKYQVTTVPSFLYSIGVSYHSTGVIIQGETKIFDFYKIDSITDRQLDLIRLWCPHFQVKLSVSQYAPELKSKILCFPKVGYFRLIKDGELV